MNQLNQSSEMIKLNFNEVSRKLVRQCSTCGEYIYHVTRTDGKEFNTECRCIERVRDIEEMERMKNDKTTIIEYNKQHCGFTKRDIEDVNATFRTSKGNIKAYNTLISYANAFSDDTSLGFYIYGNVGVGKSLLAKKVMKILLSNGYSTYITNIIQLMKDIKSELPKFKSDTLRKCQEVDLLVIDDIGTEKPTDFDMEQMFLIINSRYENKKPIIFTSNCKLDDIVQKYDMFGRIYSRIVGTTQFLEIVDNDNRVHKQ